MGIDQDHHVRGASLASQSAMRALPPATAGHSPVAVSGARELCELLFPHSVRAVRGAGPARRGRGGDAGPVPGGGGGVPGVRRVVIAGAQRLCPHGGRRAGRGPPGGDPAGGAAVLVPQPGLPQRHVRRAGGRADRPVPAAQPAAAGVTGSGRAGAGGPGRGPAGRRAGRRGAPDHAAAAGRRPARARDRRRPADPRGR